MLPTSDGGLVAAEIRTGGVPPLANSEAPPYARVETRMRDASVAGRAPAAREGIRWFCVLLGLLGVLLVAPTPVAQADDGAGLASQDDPSDSTEEQPTPLAIVAADEDDDALPVPLTGTLPGAVAAAHVDRLEWIASDTAQPFTARLDLPPAVRAPPTHDRS